MGYRRLAPGIEAYLKFSFIEDIDEFLRNEFVESRHEALELVFDTSLDSPLSDEIDVFFLVIFVDFDVLAAWLQVYSHDFSESIVFDGEAVLDDIGNVILAIRISESFSYTLCSSLSRHSQHPGK